MSKKTLTTALEPHAEICGNCVHREKTPIVAPVMWTPFDEECGNPKSAYKGDPVRHWHTCSKFERRP